MTAAKNYDLGLSVEGLGVWGLRLRGLGPKALGFRDNQNGQQIGNWACIGAYSES